MSSSPTHYNCIRTYLNSWTSKIFTGSKSKNFLLKNICIYIFIWIHTGATMKNCQYLTCMPLYGASYLDQVFTLVKPDAVLRRKTTFRVRLFQNQPPKSPDIFSIIYDRHSSACQWTGEWKRPSLISVTVRPELRYYWIRNLARPLVKLNLNRRGC